MRKIIALASWWLSSGKYCLILGWKDAVLDPPVSGQMVLLRTPWKSTKSEYAIYTRTPDILQFDPHAPESEKRNWDTFEFANGSYVIAQGKYWKPLEWLSRGAVIIGFLVVCALFGVFCFYLYVICQDEQYLKSTVETAIRYAIVALVIPGINAVWTRRKKKLGHF